MYYLNYFCSVCVTGSNFLLKQTKEHVDKKLVTLRKEKPKATDTDDDDEYCLQAVMEVESMTL